MTEDEINEALQLAYDSGFNHGIEVAAKNAEAWARHAESFDIPKDIAAAIRARSRACSSAPLSTGQSPAYAGTHAPSLGLPK
jgi:hypothetical protein